MSPAGFRHGRVTWRIAKLLGEHVEENDIGVLVAAETGFLIRRDPDTVRAADIAFVSAATLLRIGDHAGFAEVPPDMVIEVKSPSDRESAIIEKTQDWLAAGTRCVINVDPETRSVRVDFADGVSQRLSDQQELSVDVVPGWKPKVAELFA
jgi:Uma2 family endonuclease